jgi:hypothetical protein
MARQITDAGMLKGFIRLGMASALRKRYDLDVNTPLVFENTAPEIIHYRFRSILEDFAGGMVGTFRVSPLFYAWSLRLTENYEIYEILLERGATFRNGEKDLFIADLDDIYGIINMRNAVYDEYVIKLMKLCALFRTHRRNLELSDADVERITRVLDRYDRMKENTAWSRRRALTAHYAKSRKHNRREKKSRKCRRAQRQ